eukprot:COSAG05_NODE_2452_length_3047_cov_1.466418_4_plen_123_part_00
MVVAAAIVAAAVVHEGVAAMELVAALQACGGLDTFTELCPLQQRRHQQRCAHSVGACRVLGCNWQSRGWAAAPFRMQIKQVQKAGQARPAESIQPLATGVPLDVATKASRYPYAHPYGCVRI